MKSRFNWFFEDTKNTYSGANDPIYETFRANPYYSIVRESIQNSMDVQLDKSMPVQVRFEIISINQLDYPELFSISEHIDSCYNFHKSNEQARELYGGMLNFLKENKTIKILKISDFNTEGMAYEQANQLCAFTSFMGEGISSKTSGKGGSFGFGKGAYYVLSEIRTIIVSTMVENSMVFFQGRTRLASHSINGNRKGKDGYFKIDEMEPVSTEESIPNIFKRKDRGTDVYIVGLQDDPDCGKEMVKSVLNNFWLAIHENRLDVEIITPNLKIQFDEKNLESILNEYFTEEEERGPIKDLYQWNPKAYYKAVKYANQSEQLLVFNDILPILGEVKLYLYRKDGLMNRISFFRKPAMTVFKAGRSIISGYAAVFVCENDVGDEILRQMENAAHNEWEPENVRYKQKSELKRYREAKKELNEFIRKTLSSISGLDSATKIEITGLTEYLSIPEELLDEAEPVYGEAPNSINGLPSTQPSDEETGLITTKTQIVKPRIKKPYDGQVGTVADPEPTETEVFTGGSANLGTDGYLPSSAKGSVSASGIENPYGTALLPIPIRARVAAEIKDGEIVHNLIVVVEKEYDNATIHLGSGTDNGDLSRIVIKTADKGTVIGNSISDLYFTKGKNIIKILFADNLKHTLNITAHEVQ